MPAKIAKIEKPALGPVWGLGAGQSSLAGTAAGRQRVGLRFARQ